MNEHQSNGGSPAPLWTIGGDARAQRQAIAAWVLDNQDQIRAIARRKLTRSTRSVFDSEDILSSVLRRLDGMAQRGRLQPRNEDELWALVAAIARNTALSKTQLIERVRARVSEDGPYAQEVLRRLNACADDDEATLLVHRMMHTLKQGPDRQILAMMLRGASHRAIAAFLGTTEAASRQRWKRIRDELCERFREGALDA